MQSLDGLLQSCELGFATNQGRIQADNATQLGGLGSGCDDEKYRHQRIPALDPDCFQSLSLEGMANKPVCLCTYQHCAWLGRTLQAASQIDSVTRDNEVTRSVYGADNKAGVAEIMGALQYLKENPGIQHGKIRIAFTVDEEIGAGVDHFDVGHFGAAYAYTIDGSAAGEVEDETFCADSAIIRIYGVNVHPGYAKNKLINGVKIAGEFLELLPKDALSPETTSDREGYVHEDYILWAMERLVRRFPALALSEIGGGWSGIMTITPDWQPALGNWPECPNLYCAAGFSGKGFQISPAVGGLMAGLITGDQEASKLLAPFTPTRFVDGHLLHNDHESQTYGLLA